MADNEEEEYSKRVLNLRNGLENVSKYANLKYRLFKKLLIG